MINFLSLHTEANPAITGLAHAHGSSYPLSGCTSALPFSVSLDSVKVGKISTDTVQLTLPCHLLNCLFIYYGDGVPLDDINVKNQFKENNISYHPLVRYSVQL
jgi:hypothetical protein